MVTFLQLIVGFAVLIKGADWLVEGASSLAKRLKVSDLVIGLTVVAFGTSTPELFVNIFASFKGTTDIAIGNILGSNIFNIFFILGVSVLIAPIKVTHNTIWKEIPFSLLAAVMVLVLANDRMIDHGAFSVLSRIDGITLLAFFLVFMAYILAISKDYAPPLEERLIVQGGVIKLIGFVVAGLLCLILGGKLIVDSAVSIARTLGVSEALIGLTIVAAGTSLPELATSAVAAQKKNSDIAIGNIVGSNIFNIFFILGISAVIKPLPFGSGANFDVLITILASVVLFVSLFIGKRKQLTRLDGIIFLAIYFAYLWFIIRRG